MATKPASLIPWDSGGVNLVAVTGTHQTNGFAFGEIPTSGEQNSLQQNAYFWLLWLINNVSTITRNRFPQITVVLSGTWAAIGTNQQAGVHYGVSLGTNAGAKYLTDLDVPIGYKVSTLTVQLNTLAGWAGTNVFITLEQNPTSAAAIPVVVATFTAQPGANNLGTDFTMNMLATSTGLTVTVNAAGGTYTRSAGSFITDGFFVGQQVQWAGFVNGGNNALKTITALTATAMTVSVTGLVNETGPAAAQSAAGVSPVADNASSYFIGFSCANLGLTVSGLRYTLVPQ